MTRGLVTWFRATLLAAVMLTNFASVDTRAQSPLDEARALDDQVVELYRLGKAGEAVTLARHALAIRETALPAGHPDIALSLNNLAFLYHAQGRLTEAEPLYTRALAMREVALPAGHPSIALSLNNLALLYKAQGRLIEAEPHLKRALGINEKALTAGHADIAKSLNNLALLYEAQGRLAEAEPLFTRALAMLEASLPAGHPDIATNLNNLALLYVARGRVTEAEPLYTRALAIREAALPAGHPDIAASLNNMAGVYVAQGRLTEAEPLYKRALAMHEASLPAGHPDIATSLNNLASLYQDQGRFSDAEPLYIRTLGMRETALPAGHPDIAVSLNNLAALYKAQGRLVEAEQLYTRALAMREVALPAGHPSIAASLNNLAGVYVAQGRLTKAEPLYKRTLAMQEASLPAGHPSIASSLNNLAFLYEAQGRLTEAETISRRALEIREQGLPEGHRDIAGSLYSLARSYVAQQRLMEAEPLYKRALEIIERALPAGHPEIAVHINNVALLYQTQGRLIEAEPLLKSALAITEKALPAGHPDIATSLNNLASLYQDQGRLTEAEPLYKRALAMHEASLPTGHPSIATSLNNLAAIHTARREWEAAHTLLLRGTDMLIRRSQRGGDGEAPARGTGGASSEATRSAGALNALIIVAHQLAIGDAARHVGLMADTFTRAQWATASEAAAALAQMGARSVKSDSTVASLVRQGQDLVGDWRQLDKALIAFSALPPQRRDAAAELAQRRRLAATEASLAVVDRKLAKDFPEYVALSRPEPASITDVQAVLRPDEALVLILDAWAAFGLPEATFIWVVTREQARWVRSDIGRKALTREVTALRCGLDNTTWRGQGEARCRGLVQSNVSAEDAEAGKPLPFDARRSHSLYTALFGEVRDLIKGKHLLIVPSGPLTQLPFQVLVTAQPASSDLKMVRWLARDHALTVLPAVSSLKALRRVAKPSAATLPMIGFGNPLLDGDQKHPEHGGYHKKQAALARAYKGCAQAVAQQSRSLRGPGRGLTPIPQLGGLVDVTQLRLAAPLPETADELCAVAHDLNIDVNEIRLGERATERDVKALSLSGKLAQYRIVHFATHGALAGQLSGAAEPGLILTPPATASEEDDGYLSASEIAGLKLDADWVILSACNTAGPAGGGQATSGVAGAEALGGLARAFFYAQARALLVSHWEVDSETTVKLITKAVGIASGDVTVGRSEALRRSMLALIDHGTEAEAHPSMWAPFVVVGEGAAAVQVPSTTTSAPNVPPVLAVTPASSFLPPPAKPQARKKAPPKAKALAKGAPDDWRTKVFEK